MHPLGFDCASSSRLMTAILTSWQQAFVAPPCRLPPLLFFFILHFFWRVQKKCVLHFHSSDQLFSQAKIKSFYGGEGRAAGSCSRGLKDRSDLSPEAVHLRWVTGARRDFVVWLESQQSPGSGRLQRGANHFLRDNKLKKYQVFKHYFFRGNCS